MPTPGTVWAPDAWSADAWAADTWADAGAGPVPDPSADEATFLPVLRRRRRHARLFSMILLLLVA